MKRALAIRIAGWMVALALLALPVVGLLEGWFAASRWPVRALRVDAPFVHVGADRIRAVATPLLAGGFFAVDLERVRSAVAALPWVERVEVRKRWPDQVELRVHEQQAFARWNDDALVNRHGGLFRVPQPGVGGDLPDLGGPDDRLDDVLAFYLDTRERFEPVGRRVTGVHLSERGAWRIELDGGAELMVGRNRVKQRLARFIDTYARLVNGHGRGFEYVDLRYSNGYAVRWPPAANPDGGPPRA